MLEGLSRWSRVALVLAIVAIGAGAGVYGYRYFTRPVTLTIAAGSVDGEGQRLMTAIGARLAASKSPVRLKIIDKGSALAATQARSISRSCGRISATCRMRAPSCWSPMACC
jgi:hypothetical protein